MPTLLDETLGQSITVRRPIVVRKRQDLGAHVLEAIREKYGVDGCTPDSVYGGFKLQTIMDCVKKYVGGANFVDEEPFKTFGFYINQLNSLPILPLGGQIPSANNWFAQNGIDPLWLIAIALRFDVGKFTPNQGFSTDGLKTLFPFDDIHIAINEKKVFFTYYFDDGCVTIPDSPVEHFPTPEFLAVLRVAMDGLK